MFTRKQNRSVNDIIDSHGERKDGVNKNCCGGEKPGTGRIARGKAPNGKGRRKRTCSLPGQDTRMFAGKLFMVMNEYRGRNKVAFNTSGEAKFRRNTKCIVKFNYFTRSKLENNGIEYWGHFDE